MKILLVKPYSISDHIQPSLGLGYLASAVRDGNNVKILDCIKENIDIPEFKNRIKKENPDLIGLQCYTFDITFIKEALRIIKDIDRRIITVIGGPHASAAPEDSMEYFGRYLDYLFAGEAERGFREFVDYVKGQKGRLEEIAGLVWRKDGVVRVNEKYVEEDLDKLGILAWDLIRPDTYPESQHGAFYKKFPIAPIMLTRGCPFDCTFCAGKVISGRKLRKRSIYIVIEEIKLLHDKYGIREFHIIDDNFTLDKRYVKEFLDELEKLNLDISWALPNGIRMENLDPDFLRQMKRTGLYLVSLGIESGSDRVLGLMKKGLSVERIKKAVKMIRDSGLETAGFFILGFPGETKQEICETIRFSLNLGLRRANYFTYLPFPGTESYEQLRRKGELGKVNWDKFYFSKAPYCPEGITCEDLKRLQRKAFLRFYLRPRIFLRNLSDVKSFRHFGYLLKRFTNWILAN